MYLNYFYNSKNRLMVFFLFISLLIPINAQCSSNDLPGLLEEIDSLSVREINSETLIIKKGAANALIVYPSKYKANYYKDLAEEIQSAIREATGIEIDVLDDSQVTDKEHPILLEEYRDKNLILLGRLGINKAIGPVYARFLCAADGYYPGGDGYVLRTASNVYSNGANSLIIAGSNENGVKKSTDKFIEVVKGLAWDKSDLAVPWQLDVELGGECLEVFNKQEKSRMATGFKVDPAGSVISTTLNPPRHFYENMMNFYWSGRKSYFDLAMQYLSHICVTSDDIGMRSHYTYDTFVRAYNMVDESGLLDPKTVYDIDKRIVRTFIKIEQHPWEVKLRGLMNLDLIDIPISDHITATWLADKVMGDYILDELQVADPIRGYTQTRRDNARNVHNKLIKTRWRGTPPDSNTNDVVAMRLLKFAFEEGKYSDYFDSGHAYKSALYHLMRIDNVTGKDMGLGGAGVAGNSAYKLMLLTASSYYKDAELRRIAEDMPLWIEPHYGVYQNRVHMYYPGEEVVQVGPEKLNGAHFVSLQDTHFNMAEKSSAGLYRNTKLSKDQTYNLAGIRDGYTSKGDYLLVGGLTYKDTALANTIIFLTLNGRPFLQHSISGLYFDQNAVTVQDSSKWDTSGIAPAAAELTAIGTMGDIDIIQSTLPDYGGVDWTRNAIRFEDRFFLVLDQMTALEDGEFHISANWHAKDFYEVDGARWKIGKDRVVLNAGAQKIIEDGPKTIRQNASATLKQGEHKFIANLFFLNGANASYEIRNDANAGSIIKNNDELIFVGIPEMKGLETDAALALISENKLVLSGATRVAIQGKSLLESDKAFGLSLDFAKNTCTLSPAHGEQEITVKVLVNQTDGQAIKVGHDTKVSFDAQHLGGWEQSVGSKLASRWSNAQADDAAGQKLVDIKGEALKEAWRSDVALKPGLIRTTKRIDQYTYDFGQEVNLSKTRSGRGGFTGDLYYSVNEPPREGVEGMQVFEGKREAFSGTIMYAYGQTKVVEDWKEQVEGKPVSARYLRTKEPAPGMRFYGSDSKESPQRIELEIRDLDNDGQQDIFLKTEVMPGTQWPPAIAEHAFWVLDQSGAMKSTQAFPSGVNKFQLLPWSEDGQTAVVASGLDGYVHLYDALGTELGKFTLGDVPQAKGWPTPAAVGLWSPDGDQEKKLIITGYGKYGFANHDLTPFGLIHAIPGRWLVDVLPSGVDLTGDGSQDTIFMSNRSIVLLKGLLEVSGKPDIAGGYSGGMKIFTLPIQYTPMRRPTTLRGGIRFSNSGPKVLVFEMADAKAPDPHYLFVARENAAVIMDVRQEFDNVEHEFSDLIEKASFVWAPMAPITAATYRNFGVSENNVSARAAFSTADGKVWFYNFDEQWKLIGHASAVLPAPAEKLAYVQRQGVKGFLAATLEGLYFCAEDTQPELIHPGSYDDVGVIDNDVDGCDVVVVDNKGAVIRLQGVGMESR